MLKSLLTLSGAVSLSLISTGAHAAVGDVLSNRCSVIEVVEKTEQWGGPNRLALNYTTAQATLACDKDMRLTGGLTLSSPFKLVFSVEIADALHSLKASGEGVQAEFIDNAYDVVVKRLGALTSFPDARKPTRRLIDSVVLTQQGEPLHSELQALLDRNAIAKTPTTAVNPKDPSNQVASWDRTLHFLSLEGDFELTIHDVGPRWWKKSFARPAVYFSARLIMTPGEAEAGTRLHRLSKQVSDQLRALIGTRFVAEDSYSSAQFDCQAELCEVVFPNRR